MIEKGLLLSGDSQPDVVVTMVPVRWKHFQNILRTLGQQQPIQPPALPNQAKQVVPPGRVDLIIEYVGKRGAKNSGATLVPPFKFVSFIIPL